MKRNLSKSPEFVKKNCYTTLVRPKLEYACAIWDPHCKNHKEELEKVQKRAARFVTNNYKMETGNSKLNLDKVEWPTLEERRLQTKLTLFQKARLKKVDISTNRPYLTEKTRHSKRLGGEGPSYYREFSKIDGHIYSFYPHTSLIWNNIPSEIRTCDNIEQFSSSICKLDLTSIKKSINFNRNVD